MSKMIPQIGVSSISAEELSVSATKAVVKRKDPPTDPSVMIDTTREQLSLQLGFIDAIDAKLGVYLGIGSALIGLLAAIASVQSKDPQVWGLRAIWLTGFVYVVLVAITMIGMWARGWKAAINTRLLYADQFDRTANASGWALVNTYEAAFRGNVPAYNLKALMIRLAPICLVVQTALLALTLWAIRVGA
jgi:hypothetical protein